MSMRTRFSVAALCVATLALASCGSDDDATTTSGGGGSTEAAATSSGPSEQAVTIAREFTGAKAEKAEGAPVVVGVVNQQGGTPAFPEYMDAAEATVKFVNDHLGGADGHPIKIEKCIVQTEEDGQKCAAEFRSKGVAIAIWTFGVTGNKSFFDTVDGTFPIIVSASATGPDTTTPHVYNFDGAAGAALNGIAEAATADGAKTVATVTTDNDAGRYTVGTVLVPALKAKGAKTTTAYFSDTATTPQMVQALQAAGAANADRLIFLAATPAQCASAYQAMQQIGIKKPVVTSPICGSDELVEKTDGGPEGWEFVAYTSNPRVESDELGQAFKSALAAYDAEDVVTTGYTMKTFGDVLAISRFANEIGFDDLSPEAYEKAINAWSGPAFGVPGDVKCGRDPKQVGVCGNFATVSTFRDAKWQDLEPIRNGK